jgi:subtilisin family serine protease
MAGLLLVAALAIASTAFLAWRDGARSATASAASDTSAAPAPLRTSAATTAGDPAGNPIIVRARRPDDLDTVGALAASLGYRELSRAQEPPAISVARPAGVPIARAITDFTAVPGVLYAEPAYPLRVSDLPGDPLYPEQPYLAAVHAPEAWDVETGDPSIIVGVLDTGIDVTHPDLAGRIWTNAREIPGNGVDDDGNGCVDDVNGCAFVQAPEDGCASPSGGDVRDDLGHGTFVSGIIAADGDNGRGMVGVARGVTVMPVKVLDCKGGGFSFSLAQGILYAAQNGAKVLNVSLGGPVDSAYIKEAIRIAREDYGVLLVAATGNDPAHIQYPAAYDTTLAVGAASAADPSRRAGFSPAGPQVDVVAIGEGILGTVPRGTCGTIVQCVGDDDLYGVGDGTSFAAPQVTGLVALMLSRNRFLGPDAIEAMIKSTADPVPVGDTPGWAGAGRVNMLRALKPPYRLGAPGASRG